MNTEEELKAFKDTVNKQELKRARSTATVFGILAMITLLSLVYSFLQNAAAKKAQILMEQEIFIITKQVETETEKVKACEKVVKDLQLKVTTKK